MKRNPYTCDKKPVFPILRADIINRRFKNIK